MRIGLLTDVYRPGFSGVANHVLLLKEALKKQGHQVSVFAFEDRRSRIPDPDVLYSPGIVLTANYPFGLRLSREARRVIGSMDILHIHQPFLSGAVALRARASRSIPLIFTSHTRYDLYMKAYLPFIPYAVAAAFTRSYMRSFSRNLSLIISPSHEMQKLLTSWQVQARTQVIPNGIQLSAFYPTLIDRQALRQRLRLPDPAFLYAFVGRMADEKNIPFLLNSFQIVCRQNPQAFLLLIGGGPKIQKIQDEITGQGLSGQVIMTGKVEYASIPDYLHAADVFVTASKTEVHPLTVLEAGASGLPVIGLDAPGVAEIVVDGETGCICPEEPQAFASQMLFLAQHPEICQEMGAKALHTARQYSSERTAEQVLEQYQALLNSSE